MFKGNEMRLNNFFVNWVKISDQKIVVLIRVRLHGFNFKMLNQCKYFKLFSIPDKGFIG